MTVARNNQRKQRIEKEREGILKTIK